MHYVKKVDAVAVAVVDASCELTFNHSSLIYSGEAEIFNSAQRHGDTRSIDTARRAQQLLKAERKIIRAMNVISCLSLFIFRFRWIPYQLGFQRNHHFWAFSFIQTEVEDFVSDMF